MILEIHYGIDKMFYGHFFIDNIETFEINQYTDGLHILNTKSKNKLPNVKLPFSIISEFMLHEEKKEIDHVGWETTGQENEEMFEQKDISPFSAQGQTLWYRLFIKNITDFFIRNKLTLNMKTEAINTEIISIQKIHS